MPYHGFDPITLFISTACAVLALGAYRGTIVALRRLGYRRTRNQVANAAMATMVLGTLSVGTMLMHYGPGGTSTKLLAAIAHNAAYGAFAESVLVASTIVVCCASWCVYRLEKPIQACSHPYHLPAWQERLQAAPIAV